MLIDKLTKHFLFLAVLLMVEPAFCLMNDNQLVTKSVAPKGTNQMSQNQKISIKNGLKDLANFQAKLDEETWQISKPEFAKLRHISLHIAKVNGSIAEICEKWEHEVAKDTQATHDLSNIKPEVLKDIIADLIMHAMQLSNLIEESPYNALSQRVTRNLQRFAPDSTLSLNE